tara:strand:+ start:4027 stop:4467 length:441 start_codon:yes stop_codon:yes gene_type:complete
MLFVSGTTKAERLAICRACEHFVSATESCGPLIIGKEIEHRGEALRLCGCIMPIKTALRVGSCPLGRWDHQFDEKDLDQMRQWLKKLPNSINASQQLELLIYYNRITGQEKQSIGPCGKCAQNLIKTIQEFVDQSDRNLLKTKGSK